MAQELTKNSQDIFLYDKTFLSLSGITGVESFDETIISAITQSGELLTIEGNSIEITDFNVEKKVLTAKGNFRVFFYDERKAKIKPSLLSKLFGER